MRKLGYIMITVIIASALGVLVLRYNNDSPTEIARQVVTALEHHDEARLRNAFCQPRLGSMIGQGEVRFTGMAYKVRQRENSAEVSVTGRAVSHAETLSINWTLTLKRQQGQWCVDSLVNNATF